MEQTMSSLTAPRRSMADCLPPKVSRSSRRRWPTPGDDRTSKTTVSEDLRQLNRPSQARSLVKPRVALIASWISVRVWPGARQRCISHYCHDTSHKYRLMPRSRTARMGNVRRNSSAGTSRRNRRVKRGRNHPRTYLCFPPTTSVTGARRRLTAHLSSQHGGQCHT